eukprot:tig00001085_g6970.t1
MADGGLELPDDLEEPSAKRSKTEEFGEAGPGDDTESDDEAPPAVDPGDPVDLLAGQLPTDPTAEDMLANLEGVVGSPTHQEGVADTESEDGAEEGEDALASFNQARLAGMADDSLMNKSSRPAEEGDGVLNKSSRPAGSTTAPRKEDQPAAGEDESGLPRLNRDQKIKEMEEKGDISFRALTNDDTDENLVHLGQLTHVFKEQLPNMPSKYILRLVFDRMHHSIVIIKRNNVIGGITYRPTCVDPAPSEQAWAIDSSNNHHVFRMRPEIDVNIMVIEIAFCAILTSEQVQGFGTRLMNHLKEHVKASGRETYLVTCADNDAVGYFEKQSFTKKITLDKARYLTGFIKDYSGVTLMQCYLYPKIDYLNITEMIQRQKEMVYRRLRDFGARGVTAGEVAGEQIPRVHRRKPSEKASGVLKKDLARLLEAVRRQPPSWPFLKPVDPAEVPDYYNVIKQAIDLQTMEEKIGKEAYTTREAFWEDMQLMFNNCRTFNAEGTRYYKCADELNKFFDRLWADFWAV